MSSSTAFRTPERYIASSSIKPTDHRKLLETLMADIQDSDNDMDVPRTPDLHFSWKELERKRGQQAELGMGNTKSGASPMTRRASDGIVGTQTPSKEISGARGYHQQGHTLASSMLGGSGRGPTPPSAGSAYSSHLSVSVSASSMRGGLTDASTTASSLLATTPPSGGSGIVNGIGIKKTYTSESIIGGEDQLSRRPISRRFERVVSAPLSMQDRERERSGDWPVTGERIGGSDAGNSARSSDHNASLSRSINTTRSHPLNNSSTSTIYSDPSRGDESNTAIANNRDMVTPATHTRTLSSSVMSTGRRPGGLARFGGPARRRGDFVLEEEQAESEAALSSLNTPPISSQNPSPASSAALSVTPPRNSPPPTVSPAASTSLFILPSRISPSSRARTVPATIQEDEPAERDVERGNLAFDRQLGLLRSSKSSSASSMSPESVASLASGSAQSDRVNRHRQSPSMPGLQSRDGYSQYDKENQIPSSRYHHVASMSYGDQKDKYGSGSSIEVDRPPPQPLRVHQNNIQSHTSPSDTQATAGHSSTVRPHRADLDLYRTPEREYDQAYIQTSVPMPPPPPPQAMEIPLLPQTVTAAPQPIPATNKRSFVVNGIAYERLGILGRGGSSKVYSVLCQTKHTVYALKKVALDRADAETLRSYLNEIELLKRMKGHDRVIQMIDHEITFSQSSKRPKVLQMLMECGETDFSMLLEEQRGKPLNMNFVGLYWQQMLQAVMAVHEQNVVHTDLKPANFVLVKGRLKIIDFGIAKAIANDTVNIHRDQQVGTVNYMSPEAIQRENGQNKLKLSYPSDVWSLGCILYQMVYGACPFQHVTGGPLVKMNHIANPNNTIAYPSVAVSRTAVNHDGKPIDPTDLSVPVREAAIDAMRGCLAYNKEERLTIPELLQHEFLQPPKDRKQLPRNTTTITLTQMSQLINHIQSIGSESIDAQGLFAELRAQNGSTV